MLSIKSPPILYIDDEAVDNAVNLWRAGGLVAFPTETVYGLGADAGNGEAVARIYAVKSRPQFNPLIVHVANIETAKRYGQWNELAEVLAARFWPGPLTLVLKRQNGALLSDLVTAGGDTVAIRVPSHMVAHTLLASFGGGIAAPSANRSGRISPTTALDVIQELGEAVPLVVDGGSAEVGLESTVVDVSGKKARLLRPGAVTRAMLKAALRTEFDDEPTETSGVLLSPGQLESHYAPTLPVRLNATQVEPNEALLAFGHELPSGAAKMRNLSERGDLIEAASNLFSSLRALDDAAYAGIAVMPIPNEGIGEAINDRLQRAAAARPSN